MKKKIIIAILLILIGVALSFTFSDQKPIEDVNEKDELTLEESLIEADGLFELEDDLLELENSLLIERYYELENRYFLLIDSYYEGEASQNQLKSEAEELLKDIDALEEKIINLNK